MSKKNVPMLRFEGFSDDWEQRKLSDVASIVGGGTPSTSNPEYWDGGIDWYAPAEIGDRIYVNKSLKTITELGKQKSSAKILPIGTVLFTSRAGIGNTAILAKEGTTNQGFQSIVPHENKLDSYFIFSRTHELKRYGEVTGAGSTFAEVSGKQMAKMPILIPYIDEQRKIGAFFGQIDEAIALHQRKLEQLMRLKQGFLQLLFVHDANVPKVRFAGFTEEWEQRNIKMVSKVFIGLVTSMTENYRDEGTLLIRNSDIKPGKFVFADNPIYLDVNFAEKNTTRRLRIGDVITVHTGDIGTSAVISEHEEGAIGFATINTRPNTDILDSNYLSTYLNTNYHKKWALKMSTGDGRSNYNLYDFNRLMIPVPYVEEQKLVGSFFISLDDNISLNENRLKAIKMLKKAFLQKMFI